ncbi:unnamed protein product [Vitrella brassicaformis CCMP3155]|uniref:Major facilitator superfamily (MFS) profile domain-containing protein n=1 Tax=Vitrella brassicaformis (strain CCMP3155) TaxID=1169540 RepID=A0A0G4ESH4_VITBC|nr:unnamed protein product [Vitrella brassicaformis CCMP3155]|eukprot:CEM01580.1 unnamed protein product [Vitrella brassicaformis CCMP3155]
MALFRLRIPSGFHYGLLALAWATLFFETLLYTVIIPITPEVLHLTPFYQGVVYIGHPLTSLILTPFSGWLIDHIGWRTMLWFPYPVLLTGSIVFAIKNSLPCYFVARALHGISSAVVWPLMLTAIAKTHPKAIVASALGVAYSSDVGTVIGPVVGGVLFALGGTRCVFLTIIVISSLLLICAFVLHPFLPADETQKPPQQEHDSGTTTEAPSSALNVVTPASLDAPASSGASTADTSGHAVPS